MVTKLAQKEHSVEAIAKKVVLVKFHIEELVEELRVLESRVPETIVKTEVVERIPLGLFLFTVGSVFLNCLMIGDLLAHGN